MICRALSFVNLLYREERCLNSYITWLLGPLSLSDKVYLISNHQYSSDVSAVSGITCYSCDTVSGFGDTCGDLATAATQTCPAATFCVAVAGEVRLPGLVATVSARRLSCDQYVDWIGQGDHQKSWLGFVWQEKVLFCRPESKFLFPEWRGLPQLRVLHYCGWCYRGKYSDMLLRYGLVRFKNLDIYCLSII